MRSIFIGSMVLTSLVPALLGAATLKSHDEKSFPAVPGGKVVVEASFPDVHVNVRAGDTVRTVVDLEVTASEGKAKRLLEEYKPVFETRDNQILIRCPKEKHGIHFEWGSTRLNGTIIVEMPAGMDLSVDTASGDCALEGDFGGAQVRLDTASGDVRIHGAMKTLSADTASGNLEAQFVRIVERVVLDTASGDTTLKGAIGSLKADTASGNLTAEGLSGDVTADSASGDVRLAWAAAPEGTRIKIDAASGNVRLTFPAETALAGRANVSSGEITSDFPGTYSKRHDRLDFQGGAGAVTLDAGTSSGDITILKAGEGGSLSRPEK